MDDTHRERQAREAVEHEIPYAAPSKEQRAELKRQAEALYATEQAAYALTVRGLGPKKTATVASYLDWYETHVTVHKKGAPREREILKTFRLAFAEAMMTDLTRDRIVEWRTGRAAKVSPSTVNREIDLLKHALAQAVPVYLDVNPIDRLKRLAATPSAEPAVLSRASEAKLLKHLAPKDQVIVICALDTLMRAGDLLRLQWTHDHGSYLTVVTPKTGVWYRVPVSSRLRAALDCLPKRGRHIFAHRRKASEARWQTNSLKQMLENGCARARLPYGRQHGAITFHALRHTGATRLMEGGVDIRTPQAIGGWKSIRMLERYLHPADASKRAAVELVGKGVAFTLRAHERKRGQKRPMKRAS